MSIPSGIPTVSRIVKNGKGGPNKDSIPAREDLGGEVTGYLANDTRVRIVNPSYPGSAKYRKPYGGTTWVQFDIYGLDLVRGKDGWCEESGHLMEIEPEPEPVETATYEILAESWEGGRRYLKVRKI